MTPLTFWFDPISPYAWLAFDQLPRTLEGLSYAVEYRPVLFAGLLENWGQKGPAEIAPKRAWTYRQVAWLAQRQGTVLELPRPHPFNPLALLRLVLAAGPNRRSVERVFRHAWCRGGADPNDAAALAALRDDLVLTRDPDGQDIKAELRAATAEAAARGIFGVPTIECDGRAFWGQDALPMLRAALDDEPWFAGPAWDDAARQPPGLARS